MTSTTKQRRDATADCLILSTAWTMALRAVSAPTDSSEPGRLLLMVAGRQMMGMLKAGKASRLRVSRRHES